METVRTKVLLIEDDRVDQMAFQRFVKGKNIPYDYAIVGSVAEAKTLLTSEKFDIVLADYLLGDGTAFDIFDLKIDAPIIMITGSGSEEIAVKAMKAGASDYLIKDPANNHLKILPVTVENVIRRKRAEEALRESKKKYRTLTENINVGVYRNTIGPEGKFIEVNTAHAEIFGYKGKEELLAIKVADLYQNPEGREKFNEKLLREGSVRNEELQLKKEDGTPIICSVSAVVVKDEQGKVEYYDGIIEDITERKKMEEEIKREKEFLENLIRESPTAILSTDSKGNVVVINRSAEELLGYKGDEIVGKSVSMVISGRTYLEIADKRDFPIDFVKKDGTEIPLSVSTSVQLLDGEQSGLIVTLKDLSELRGLFITPVSEVGVEAEMKYHLEQGFMYLIEEEKTEKSFDVFRDSVKHGSQGVYISRENPAVIRERYQLEKTPNIWLTRNKVPGGNCISPDELAKLYKTIENFILHADDGVIFFEGLEYLIAQNGFQPVLKFIQSLNDLIMINPSRAIVALDPLTMDTKELHIVRRDMRTI